MNSESKPIFAGVNPTNIHFSLHDPHILKSKIGNRKYMVVTSPSHLKNGNLDLIFSSVDQKPELIVSNVPTNPSLRYLEDEIRGIQNLDIDLVIAIGGWSSIDSAKVFARFLKNRDEKSLSLMLENGKNNVVSESIPLIAIPTTAGTGSEVTPFANIWDNERHMKLSLSGWDLHPECALVFPDLCLTAPPDVLLAAAMDAVSHAMDALWNKNASESSDSNSIKALKLLSETLLECDFTQLSTKEIEKLSLGSLYAGLAISESRTSLSHSISYPLTYTFGLPHGIACAFSLPAILSLVIRNHSFDEERLFKDAINEIFLELESFIGEIFKKHEIGKIFQSFIPEKSGVLQLMPEMLHPDRSVNFSFQLSYEDLNGIINKSLGQIYDF